MALYEYQCDQCDEIFEVIQKFADEPLSVHEKCGGKVHRLLSAPAFQFKGSGWYITDYAKSGPNGSAKKEDGSGKGEDGSGKKDDAPAKAPAAEKSGSSPSSTPSTGDSSKSST